MKTEKKRKKKVMSLDGQPTKEAVGPQAPAPAGPQEKKKKAVVKKQKKPKSAVKQVARVEHVSAPVTERVDGSVAAPLDESEPARRDPPSAAAGPARPGTKKVLRIVKTKKKKITKKADVPPKNVLVGEGRDEPEREEESQAKEHAEAEKRKEAERRSEAEQRARDEAARVDAAKKEEERRAKEAEERVAKEEASRREEAERRVAKEEKRSAAETREEPVELKFDGIEALLQEQRGPKSTPAQKMTAILESNKKEEEARLVAEHQQCLPSAHAVVASSAARAADVLEVKIRKSSEGKKTKDASPQLFNLLVSVGRAKTRSSHFFLDAGDGEDRLRMYLDETVMNGGVEVTLLGDGKPATMLLFDSVKELISKKPVVLRSGRHCFELAAALVAGTETDVASVVTNRFTLLPAVSAEREKILSLVRGVIGEACKPAPQDLQVREDIIVYCCLI